MNICTSSTQHTMCHKTIGMHMLQAALRENAAWCIMLLVIQYYKQKFDSHVAKSKVLFFICQDNKGLKDENYATNYKFKDFLNC